MDTEDACPRQPEPADAPDRDGCPDLDPDGDDILDPDDLCPEALEDGRGSQPADGCPGHILAVRRGELLIPIDGVDFYPGTVDLRGEDALHAVRDLFVADPTIALLRIEGHVRSGPPEERQALSERRAVAVMRWMAEQGVDFSRLEAVGRGDVGEGDERIEFVVVGR